MDRADFLAQVMESGERGSYKFTGGDGSRTEITGEVDFGAISFDKSLTIQNAAFDSAVKLSNRKFIDSVAFESCAFKEPIHLDKTSFKNGLKFKDCIFGAANDDLTRSMIVLDDASIRGDLVFDHVVVYGCLAARRLDLSGDIQFASCIVTADATNNDAAFNASDSKIRGSVIFETGKQSGASRDNPSVGINRSVFSDTRKSGAISVLLRGAKVTDMVNLAWARFEGELNLGFVSCRSLESDAKILVRPADVIGEQSKKARKYPGATITGALVLSGGEFGLIHLFGIYIGGEIRLIAGKSGQISIDDALCKIGNKEQFITPSLIEHFVMSRWHCSDFLFLHASIAGERIFSSARGISIKSSVIDRAVSFWPGHNVERRLERYLLSEKSTEPDKFFTDDEDEHGGAGNNRTCPDLLNRWHRRLSVNGNITIDHCTIGDDVIMTGVDVHSKDPADGRIEIVDSKVNGNVVFRSLTSFLADAEVQAPLLWLLAQRLAVGDTVQRTAFSIVASCHVLDMHGLEANNIDLTGLSIQETLGPIAHASHRQSDRRLKTSASALMSYLKVTGKVAAFARLSKASVDRVHAILSSIVALDEPPTSLPNAAETTRQNREKQLLSICFGDQANRIASPQTRLEANAQIPGSLDFQHSEIGELFISDASFFEHPAHQGAAERGIVLDYAQISKLYVARSEKHHPLLRKHNGFPVPLSLLDLSVKAWFLEEEKAGNPDHDYSLVETKTVDPYLDLLENDPEFRMSSYLAVEKSLRDRGLTDEAREIFIAANYRDVRTESVATQPDNGMSRQQRNAPQQGGFLDFRRNWKIWRRGEGRYRSSKLDDIRNQLKCSDYRALARPLMVSSAIILAAGLLLSVPSLISFGYLAVALLDLLLFSKSASRAPWRVNLIGDLRLIWLVGALYALKEIVQGASIVAVGYLATILLSSFAAEDAFGLLYLFRPKRRQIGLVLYSTCIVVGLVAVLVLSIPVVLQLWVPGAVLEFKTSLLAFIYVIVVLSTLFVLRGNLFRLRRPRREYLGFVLCFAWCAVAVGFGTCVVTERSFFSFGALVIWLVALFPLSAAMRCFFDQLYWSLVDYGTSAVRLAGLIVVLMAISFAFVSGNASNFESTLLARSVSAERHYKGDAPSPDDWVFGERVWMTLRYHVPLVGAIVSEEWQPADTALRFNRLTDGNGNLRLPDWWCPRWAPPWPRARDWYGAMLWLNWILWPLFLPFLIHKLSRER